MNPLALMNIAGSQASKAQSNGLGHGPGQGQGHSQGIGSLLEGNVSMDVFTGSAPTGAKPGHEFLNLMMGALYQSIGPSMGVEDLPANEIPPIELPAAELDAQLAELVAHLQELGIDIEGLQAQLQTLDLSGQLNLLKDTLQNALTQHGDSLNIDEKATLEGLVEGLEQFDKVINPQGQGLSFLDKWQNNINETGAESADNAQRHAKLEARLKAIQENLPPEARQALKEVIEKLEQLSSIDNEDNLLLPTLPPKVRGILERLGHPLQKVKQSVRQLELQVALQQDGDEANAAQTLQQAQRPVPKLQGSGLPRPIPNLPPHLLHVLHQPDNLKNLADEQELNTLAPNRVDGTNPNGLSNPVQLGLSGKIINPGQTAQSVESQLVEAAQMAQAKGETKFTMQLTPKELGKVRVTLSSDLNNQLTARIVTELADTKQLLESTLKELHQNLERAGINVARVTVVQASQETAGQQFDFNQSQQDPQNPNEFQSHLADQQSKQQEQSNQTAHQSAGTQKPWESDPHPATSHLKPDDLLSQNTSTADEPFSTPVTYTQQGW